MPFRGTRYQGTFTPAELQILQDAYNKCCAFLDRCPTTHEDRDTLARMIIRTFESGEHDPEQVAAITAKMELLRN